MISQQPNPTPLFLTIAGASLDAITLPIGRIEVIDMQANEIFFYPFGTKKGALYHFPSQSPRVTCDRLFQSLDRKKWCILTLSSQRKIAFNFNYLQSHGKMGESTVSLGFTKTEFEFELGFADGHIPTLIHKEWEQWEISELTPRPRNEGLIDAKQITLTLLFTGTVHRIDQAEQTTPKTFKCTCETTELKSPVLSYLPLRPDQDERRFIQPKTKDEVLSQLSHLFSATRPALSLPTTPPAPALPTPPPVRSPLLQYRHLITASNNNPTKPHVESSGLTSPSYKRNREKEDSPTLPNLKEARFTPLDRLLFPQSFDQRDSSDEDYPSINPF